MLDEKAPTSLYFQLKEILVEKIKTHIWGVNQKIPTERELCELYRVSRITVRQALDELEKEGYLYRKQGKGTFVTVPKIEQSLQNFYSFSEEIKKMGGIPTTKVLDFLELAATDEIAEKLNINKASPVYSIKRLRMSNEEPFALEVSYIPRDICPGLTKEAVESKGLYNSILELCGIYMEEAEESFEAILVDPISASYLNVSKNSAGLLLERLTKSKGTVIEYCNSLIRGDRFKYRVSLTSDAITR
jgi:GntR family transcriptional regulator